jgi:two-component system LytT family response regulator
MTSNPLRCIILDDENPAVLLLAEYVKKTPGLELVLATTKPNPILEIIEQGKADLLFLDVQMPELSGIEIMQIIGQSATKVILTTAYSEFALASYSYNVIDYLLKPITFERFATAVSKAKERFQLAVTNPKNTPSAFIFVKTEYRIKKIELSAILYIEALGDYITFNLPDEKILSLERMKNIEALLPEDDFIRIHKSFIVNKRHIDFLEKGRIIIQKNYLPIGEAYKQMVKEKLGI